MILNPWLFLFILCNKNKRVISVLFDKNKNNRQAKTILRYRLKLDWYNYCWFYCQRDFDLTLFFTLSSRAQCLPLSVHANFFFSLILPLFAKKEGKTKGWWLSRIQQYGNWGLVFLFFLFQAFFWDAKEQMRINLHMYLFFFPLTRLI